MIRFVIRASYGNDSVALIQWARESGLTDVVVLYSDTGWARKWWAERVAQMEVWVESLGFTPARTQSIGMEALVRSKKMWPQRLMQFCTKELKIKPTMEWLAENDPYRIDQGRTPHSRKVQRTSIGENQMTEIKTPTTVAELEAILNSEPTAPIAIRPDGTIQALHPRRLTEPVVKAEWPDPTPEMLTDPKFEAIWQTIKSWDINVPEVYGGYCGANGNHVRAILDALAKVG